MSKVNELSNKIQKKNYLGIIAQLIILIMLLFSSSQFYGLSFLESEINDTSDKFDPVALFLTWQRDPTTTMTIDWHTTKDHDSQFIEYRETGSLSWQKVPFQSHPLRFSDRMIHRAEILGLNPATYYEFRFGENSEVYNFRTMPDNLKIPVTFAVGGDTGSRMNGFGQVNRQVMQYDPDFVVFGGDIAYADGDPRNIDRWYEWFSTYKNTLITPENRVVPALMVIAGHELFYYSRQETEEDWALVEEWGLEDREVTFFHDLFASPGHGTGHDSYAAIHFNDYMSIFLLDTDGPVDMRGEQTEWFENELKESQHVPHLFPVYHSPGYPSVRDHNRGLAPRIRQLWSPLFENYGVKVAFEHHDHAYKRTHPIKNGQIDPDGVVYLGDGAWGVGIREPHAAEDVWYLKKTAAELHAIVVTIQEDVQDYAIINVLGNIIDTHNTHGESFYEPTPAQVELMYPTPRLTSVDIQPVFKWAAARYATSYQFELLNYNTSHLILDSTLTDTTLNFPTELESGETYYWRVRGFNKDSDGLVSNFNVFTTYEATSAPDAYDVPFEFRLDQNFPNPFNPETNIGYQLPEDAHVTIEVHDLIGRLVKVLVKDNRSAGSHTAIFNSGSLASGVYHYRIEATSNNRFFTQSKNMTLLK